nr:ALPV-157 [Albatrosspox virus]
MKETVQAITRVPDFIFCYFFFLFMYSIFLLYDNSSKSTYIFYQ